MEAAMRFSMSLDPRRSWADMARLAQGLEAAGWHCIYVCDHFIGYDPADAVPHGDLLESWTSLTAIGGVTDRIKLGTLVLGNTYRHPAVVANMAATLDHVSGGRVVLGLGAGWQPNEHRAYGIALPDPRQRIARFGEAVTITTSLLREPRTTFDGEYYSLHDAVCDPKPIQSPLPILVGGGGERRTMRIAAQFADIWHSWAEPAEFARKNDVLDAHCNAIGRDPATIARATGATVAFGPPDLSERDWDATDVVGTADVIIARLRQFSDAGTDEFIVRDHGDCLSTPATLDVIARLTAEVIPHLA
jgi:F420-dependent oxidoreductase-like protein